MYCVLNLGWTPSQYINLTPKEKAFVTASILVKIDEQKKQERQLKAKKPNVRRR